MRFSGAATAAALAAVVGSMGSPSSAFTATVSRSIHRPSFASSLSPSLVSRPMSTKAAASTDKATSSSSSSSSADNQEGEFDSDIPPEFAAARDAVIESVRAALDTPSMHSMLAHFTNEYFTAAAKSYAAGNTQFTPQDAASRFTKALQLGMEHGMGGDRYTFGVTHTALRGKDVELEDGNTFDYYNFGCDFFRPAMDIEKSVVLGKDNLQKAFDQIKAGENVVFFANHQSEADPQVFSVLLEEIGFGDEAADVTYVAGHKVTTDALAIPFSMGRNLLCIHSKKHLNSDPDLKPVKQKQNLAAMSAMLDMMKQGGASLWVAPSGGRDRRDTQTNDVPIAPFDQKTIDMFRLMGTKSKVTTHYYPLAMVSYDLCPPPDHVEAGVGEERNVRFVPIGIACGEEVPNVGAVGEGRHLFTERAFNSTEAGYEMLLDTIDKKMRGGEDKEE